MWLFSRFLCVTLKFSVQSLCKRLLNVARRELLIVKVVLMFQERMFNVGVAVVAPERKISERENDWVICVLHVVQLFHM